VGAREEELTTRRVVYTNRTFTDQVAGFGSNVRHSVGRSKMMSAVIRIFETLQKRVPA
jgi:hypothetical protein